MPRIAATAKPESGIVVQILRIMEPAPFIQVMTGGATDGIVFPCPPDRRQEFIDDKPRGCLFDVFPVRPPAEIVRPLDVFVRTL